MTYVRRFHRFYFVEQSRVVNALGLGGESITGFSWEGVGRTGNLLVHLEHEDSAYPPIPQITVREEPYLTVPWMTIENEFFSSIQNPAKVFERLFVVAGEEPVGTPVLFFDLNREQVG